MSLGSYDEDNKDKLYLEPRRVMIYQSSIMNVNERWNQLIRKIERRTI